MENDVVLKLELSVNEVNIILMGLGKLPLESSVSTWAKIKQSAESQIKDLGIELPLDSAND